MTAPKSCWGIVLSGIILALAGCKKGGSSSVKDVGSDNFRFGKKVYGVINSGVRTNYSALILCPNGGNYSDPRYYDLNCVNPFVDNSDGGGWRLATFSEMNNRDLGLITEKYREQQAQFDAQVQAAQGALDNQAALLRPKAQALSAAMKMLDSSQAKAGQNQSALERTQTDLKAAVSVLTSDVEKLQGPSKDRFLLSIRDWVAQIAQTEQVEMVNLPQAVARPAGTQAYDQRTRKPYYNCQCLRSSAKFSTYSRCQDVTVDPPSCRVPPGQPAQTSQTSQTRQTLSGYVPGQQQTGQRQQQQGGQQQQQQAGQQQQGGQQQAGQQQQDGQQQDGQQQAGQQTQVQQQPPAPVGVRCLCLVGSGKDFPIKGNNPAACAEIERDGPECFAPGEAAILNRIADIMEMEQSVTKLSDAIKTLNESIAKGEGEVPAMKTAVAEAEAEKRKLEAALRELRGKAPTESGAAAAVFTTNPAGHRTLANSHDALVDSRVWGSTPVKRVGSDKDLADMVAAIHQNLNNSQGQKAVNEARARNQQAQSAAFAWNCCMMHVTPQMAQMLGVNENNCRYPPIEVQDSAYLTKGDASGVDACVKAKVKPGSGAAKQAGTGGTGTVSLTPGRYATAADNGRSIMVQVQGPKIIVEGLTLAFSGTFVAGADGIARPDPNDRNSFQGFELWPQQDNKSLYIVRSLDPGAGPEQTAAQKQTAVELAFHELQFKEGVYKAKSVENVQYRVRRENRGDNLVLCGAHWSRPTSITATFNCQINGTCAGVNVVSADDRQSLTIDSWVATLTTNDGLALTMPTKQGTAAFDDLAYIGDNFAPQVLPDNSTVNVDLCNGAQVNQWKSQEQAILTRLAAEKAAREKEEAMKAVEQAKKDSPKVDAALAAAQGQQAQDPGQLPPEQGAPEQQQQQPQQQAPQQQQQAPQQQQQQAGGVQNPARKCRLGVTLEGAGFTYRNSIFPVLKEISEPARTRGLLQAGDVILSLTGVGGGEVWANVRAGQEPVQALVTALGSVCRYSEVVFKVYRPSLGGEVTTQRLSTTSIAN